MTEIKYSSPINDATYRRLETEEDRVKSELSLNKEHTLYKATVPDTGETYRMIIPSSTVQPYITANAIKYFGFKPDSLTSYSLAGKELVIESIEL